MSHMARKRKVLDLIMFQKGGDHAYGEGEVENELERELAKLLEE